MRLLSTLAVRLPLERDILPRLPFAVQAEWLPTTLALRRLAEGAAPDLLILTDEALAEGPRVPLVRSALGLAVRAGAPRPEVADEAGFRAALLAARRPCWSRAGASGIHLEGVLERLGIAEAVRPKALVIPQGFTAERLLTGEADLAVQQVSELLMVPGAEVFARFPEALQQRALFSARAAPQSAEAAALLAALAAPEGRAALRAAGLEPVA
ncbi:substrate-binding domain-containing protein [Roseococcus sp. DSY-14]|uniref:substrate-binding domain-containing protein n=1 Tax=Roseococcus sp. DSY-14 TaxID=3369650 RepID=UPI00387A9990